LYGGSVRDSLPARFTVFVVSVVGIESNLSDQATRDGHLYEFSINE